MGCANFSEPVNGVISLDRSNKIIQRALDNGIKIFDTSSQYGGSEVILSNALKSVKDADCVVISKCAGDNKKSQVAASIERFGGKLGAILLHNWTPSETVSYVEADMMNFCHKQNIKFGASTYGVNDAMTALDTGLFDMLEFEFNLLNWFHMQHVLSRCYEVGVLPVVRSVLARGYLTDQKLDLICPLAREILFLKRIAEEHGMSLEEMAIRFVLEFVDIGIVLFGADYPHQVDLNSDQISKPELDPKLVKQIASVTWNIPQEKWDLRKWK